jgi:hypothetical protein
VAATGVCNTAVISERNAAVIGACMWQLLESASFVEQLLTSSSRYLYPKMQHF